MGMSQSSQPILTQLAENGIVSPDDAAKVQATLDSSELATSAKEIADQLVQLDKLTPYQAKTLVAGDLKHLVLGSYVLLDQLGEGGMGRVFKARHRGMDRLVAIKMLLPEKLSSKSGLKRFAQEVKAAARLTHPNIVTAFDADLEGEVPYLVMEYVDGKDLQSYLTEHGPLPIDTAVGYIRQAARGLAHAHSVGIIHRDIKPGNLLLDKQGTIRILDLGVAQLRPMGVGEEPPADIHAQITRDGAVIGTVDFMAPEQAASAKQADERSDIYSLGCTLYFLLTNEPVYRADSVVDRLIAHRQRPIPSLRVARPDVSPPLDAIFQRMVAKNPADRFANMSELLAALDSLPAQPAGPPRVSIATAPTVTSHQEIEWVDDRAAKEPARTSSRRVTATTLGLLLLAALFLAITASFAYESWSSNATLKIHLSEPGAVVFVIDRRTDQAAANVQTNDDHLSLRLPAGEYQVQVAKDGYHTSAVDVSLRPWRWAVVDVELTRDENHRSFVDELLP